MRIDRSKLLILFTVMVFAARGVGQRAVLAEDRPALEDGGRIVFFGDSITQSGGYVADIEAFLLTRFPSQRFRVFNHGRASETISGTSESDHHPRRPNAHERFSRDVAAWKPTMLVACFGMNDGNYHPFEPERFMLYRRGIERLIERTRMETHAKLVLASPPPFDAYRRAIHDPHASDFGYKFPAIDYDRALDEYSRWLLTLAGHDPDVSVVDLHSALTQHLTKRRVGEVSFFLSGDAIHPGSTGHWLIAQALLLSWRVPRVVAEAMVDVTERDIRIIHGAIRKVVRNPDRGLEFTWRSPLPMAVDSEWDARSLEVEELAGRINHYRLTIMGLADSKYRLFAHFDDTTSEQEVAVVSGTALGQGLDVTRLKSFPTVARAQRVRNLVIERRRGIDEEWRRQIASEPERLVDPKSSMFADDDSQMAEIRRMCLPRDVHVRLVPST